MRTDWSWHTFNSVIGAFLLVFAFHGPVQAQEPAQVTGTVTDAAGNAIPSVSVTITEMQIGASTNQQGRYLIVVPASRVQGQEVTVRAELIGRASQTQMVTLSSGSSVVADFELAEDPLRLEELVVTGAGTSQLREQLGVTINTVRAEAIERSQESNIVAAMAGTAPNVEVTSSSGDPGSGSYIRIRGANSLLGDGQPLFVVDGVPLLNSSNETDPGFDDVAGTSETNRAFDLNPADIEDIQILKGPSASAIYGSRAADGVVLITTRTGQAGTSNMSYRSNYTFNEVNRMPDLQTTYGQGITAYPGLNADFGLPAGTLPEDPSVDLSGAILGTSQDAAPTSWGPAFDGPAFDHSDDIFETGNRLEQFFTFSGGSETTDYYLSLGHMNHDGYIEGPQSYQRTTVRLNGSHAFRDDLRLSANFQYTDSEGDMVQQGSNISGVLLGALRTPPDFNNRPYLVEHEGQLLHRSFRYQNPTSVTASRGYDNPLWIANEISNTTDVGRTFGNITADYTPFNWLSIDYTLGADYAADERTQLFPKSSSDFPDGRLVRTDFVNFQLDHNLVATLTQDFNQDISGTLALGQNLNHREYRRLQVNGRTLLSGSDQLDYTVSRTPNEYREIIRTDGYFAQGTLDLYDELFLTAALRMDGSSTFGSDDNRFFYPKFSGAWTFTDRLQEFTGDGVSFAKLRFAYGVAGKQPEPYSNTTGFVTGILTDGWLTPNGLETIYQGNEGTIRDFIQGNERIDPERITEWEVGGELAFLDDRLSMGVTYYQQHTEDAILDVDVVPSTGYWQRFANAAEFENWGWEATLDARIYDGQDFAWNVGFQWAQNASCVKDLAGTEVYALEGFTGSINGVVAPERDADGNITKCYPINTFYGSDWIRFGRGSTVGGTNIDEANSDWNAGDVYIGADGYPMLDGQTRAIGDANPDWTGSVQSTVTLFDNLEISGLVDIKAGGENWNGTRGALYYFGTHQDTEPHHGAGQDETFGETFLENESVAGPGAGTAVPINWFWYLIDVGSGFTGPSSQFIEDAGFVKLRNITVRYTMDNMDWMDRLGFSSMTLGVSGRNLQTWTDYTGIDPESNLTGQTLGRGIDYFNNPQTRSYVVSVSLNR